VPLHGTADLFVGHPVTADNREVFIQVTQTGEDAWAIEAHNPTDLPITTTLRSNPAFGPLAAKLVPQALTLAPGSSVTMRL